MKSVIHGRKKIVSSFWGGCWHREEVSFCGKRYVLGDFPPETTNNDSEVTCKKCLISIKRVTQQERDCDKQEFVNE